MHAMLVVIRVSDSGCSTSESAVSEARSSGQLVERGCDGRTEVTSRYVRYDVTAEV